ncbi:MFS transporter [Gordonia sp. CPCC 206044]|uniref:MFS transporter n=1 Tax=Gordonia sp. CPCC 206044 TaxID=3140793 RepID=UPI003AF33DCD
MRAARPADFPYALALLGAGAMFMEILDATIVTTALPAMAADLGVRPLDVTVVVTAYLTTLAVVIPLSGWIADRFGIRRVFVIAVAVFTAASAGCALAPDLSILVVMRVVQAAGGAMMVPLGRLAVLRTVERAQIVRAIAFLTWPALVAPVLAPLLGGLIVAHTDWRIIFAINVPIGLVGLVAAVVWCRPVEPGGRRRRLDVLGVALTTVAVAAAMTTAQELAAQTPRWPMVVVTSVTATLLGAAAIRRMRSCPDPLLNLEVVQVHSFASVIGYGTVYRVVISAVPFLLPLMFQLQFGWSPVAAGAMVAALFVGNVGIKPLTTPAMRRWGIRRVLVIDLAVSVVAFVALAALGPATAGVVVAVVLVVSGALRSIGFSAYNTLAFADVDAEHLSDANAVHAAVQELGSAFGVAFGAVAIALCAGIDALPAGAYSAAFGLLAVLTLVCVVGAIRLPASAGQRAVGRG